MIRRIDIKLKPNGTVWCFPKEVTSIRAQGTQTFATVAGVEYEVKEKPEELMGRLDVYLKD